MVLFPGPRFKGSFEWMHHWIHKSDVENWWEGKCDAFIRKEVELWLKRFRVVKNTVFYSKHASNKYKIF